MIFFELHMSPPSISTFLSSKNFFRCSCATFWLESHVTLSNNHSARNPEAGVDIVPVYGLGHTQLFSMLDKSSSLGGFLMKMSRRLKVSGIGVCGEKMGMGMGSHFQRQFGASRFPI